MYRLLQWLWQWLMKRLRLRGDPDYQWVCEYDTTTHSLHVDLVQISRQVARAGDRRQLCRYYRKIHPDWPRRRVRDLAIRNLKSA